MKRKQSIGGMFFSMFLRTVVVILLLIIIAMSVLLVHQIRQAKKNKEATEARKATSQNGNPNDMQKDDLLTAEGTTAETGDGTQNPDGDGQQAQQPSDGPDYGLSLAVLNGTYTSGLAGAWVDRLSASGYTNLHPGDYHDSMDQTTVYIMDENVTTGLTSIFPNAIFIYGSIDQESTDVDLSGMQAVLIIGSSDDIVTGGE